MGDTILVICLGVLLCWTSVSAQKSHTFSINKLEPLEANSDWMESENMWLTRKDKQVKVFNWKGTIKKPVTGNITCKVKVMQKINGNFVPALMDEADKPCCESVEQFNIIWPCLRKFSNFPEKCPIVAGNYWIDKLNLNECDIPFFLPPRSPEEYKLIFTAKDENKAILKVTGYGTAKMKILG